MQTMAKCPFFDSFCRFDEIQGKLLSCEFCHSIYTVLVSFFLVVNTFLSLSWILWSKFLPPVLLKCLLVLQIHSHRKIFLTESWIHQKFYLPCVYKARIYISAKSCFFLGMRKLSNFCTMELQLKLSSSCEKVKTLWVSLPSGPTQDKRILDLTLFFFLSFSLATE